MVELPLDAPMTRREFYREQTLVWLFILLTSLSALQSDARWTGYVLPIGALFILGLYAFAQRRRRPSI